MYLVDTNVWLERLLDQERGSDVARFLARIPSDRLAITDFAFHSIVLVLIRLNRPEVLRAFVQDLFLDGAVRRSVWSRTKSSRSFRWVRASGWTSMMRINM